MIRGEATEARKYSMRKQCSQGKVVADISFYTVKDIYQILFWLYHHFYLTSLVYFVSSASLVYFVSSASLVSLVSFASFVSFLSFASAYFSTYFFLGFWTFSSCYLSSFLSSFFSIFFPSSLNSLSLFWVFLWSFSLGSFDLSWLLSLSLMITRTFSLPSIVMGSLMNLVYSAVSALRYWYC